MPSSSAKPRISCASSARRPQPTGSSTTPRNPATRSPPPAMRNFIKARERRDLFRVQLQGPNALPLMKEVTNGTLPEIKFFHMGEFTIAGKTVRAVRHGMAGTPGFELYGAWDDQQAVREAVERIGEKYDLRKAGSLTYGTAAQESGWMPRPLPAIYESDTMAAYRRWIPAQSFEAAGSLGGSFISDKIADYYVEPFEVGYGNLVDFDHDFIGRAALEKIKPNQKRRKMTLMWNNTMCSACCRPHCGQTGRVTSSSRCRYRCIRPSRQTRFFITAARSGCPTGCPIRPMPGPCCQLP
ncbi:MAG: hypothetical protein ACK5IB_05275 [Qingshengfaniella sp.]